MSLRLIVSSILLQLVVVVVNTVLLFSSLSESYIAASISTYRAVGAGTAATLEDRLRSKKGLGTVSELSNLVDESLDWVHSLAYAEHASVRATLDKETAPAISVSLLLTNGAVLHTSALNFGEDSEPDKIVAAFWETWSRKPDPNAGLFTRDWSGEMSFSAVPCLKVDSMYYTGVPVRDADGAPLAVLAIGVPAQFLTPSIVAFYRHHWITLNFVMVMVMAITALVVKGLIAKRRSQKKNLKTRFIVYVTSVALISLVVLSAFVINAFRVDYSELNRQKVDMVLSNIGKRVAPMLGDTVQADIALQQVVDTLPDIRTISIYGNANGLVASAAQAQEAPRMSIGSWIQKRVDPFWPESVVVEESNVNTAGINVGKVVAAVSNGFVRERMFETIFAGIMSAAIGVLIIIELLLLTLKYLERYTARRKKMSDQVHYGVMRPAMFLFLFGLDSSASFVPLHMENLYEPLFGLSKDTVMGLPISVELFFVGIAILWAGVWLDRRGWHEPFLAGLMIAAMGGIYSWLAPDAFHFIAARGVAGLGFGLALMAAQGFVVRYSDKKSKAQGLAQIFAGLYAGHICGAAGGAMLAERVGFGPVFLVGALIILTAVAYTVFLMHEAFVLYPRLKRSAQRATNFPVIRFLLDRRILALIFFSSIPASIAVVGFVNYFSPIYLSRLGVSQSSIGHIIVIYGLFLVFAGPRIGKLVDESKDKRPHIIAGCLLGACAFLVFPAMDGVWAAIAALMLLGLSSSMVLASQSAYALQLRITQEFGDGKALGVFRASSRIGQVIGPLIFASAIAISEVHQFVFNLGAAYAVTAGLFAFLVYKRDGKSDLVELVR